MDASVKHLRLVKFPVSYLLFYRSGRYFVRMQTRMFGK